MNSLFQNHEKICTEIQLFDNTYHISYEIFVKKCSSWLKIIYKLGEKKKKTNKQYNALTNNWLYIILTGLDFVTNTTNKPITRNMSYNNF